MSPIAMSPQGVDIIDAEELARRLNLKLSYVRDANRKGSRDPIPHIKFGHLVRYEWNGPELTQWISNHRRQGRHS